MHGGLTGGTPLRLDIPVVCVPAISMLGPGARQPTVMAVVEHLRDKYSQTPWWFSRAAMWYAKRTGAGGPLAPQCRAGWGMNRCCWPLLLCLGRAGSRRGAQALRIARCSVICDGRRFQNPRCIRTCSSFVVVRPADLATVCAYRGPIA